MPLKPQIFPQPIGPVTVSNSGTPVPLTTELYALGLVLSVTDPVPVNKISLIALTANQGTVYVGTSTMNKTTGAGVMYKIPTYGSWSVINNVGLNTYQLQDIYLDADNDGDGIYGSVDQL